MTTTDNVPPQPAAGPGDTRDKASGPRSRKGAATRARLIQAAKAVFEEDGFLDARISDIAERAQLSHGSFYHYFDSKEEIFREVAHSVSDLLSAPIYASLYSESASLPPAERIRQGSRTFLANYQAEARIIGVIEMVIRYDPTLLGNRFENQRAHRVRGVSSLRQLQRVGWVDPSIDPELALSAMSAMMNRFAEMWFVQGLFDLDFDEGVEQLTRLCLNALHLGDEPPAQAVHE
jgi:AcrR family transcriptional regulator